MMKILFHGSILLTAIAIPFVMLSLFHYFKYLKNVGFSGYLPVLLRSCTYVIVLLFISGITIQYNDTVPVPGKVVLLIDDSQSMRMKDGTDKTRFKNAIEDIAEFDKTFGDAASKYVVSEYFKKFTSETLKDIVVVGKKTLISENLKKIISDEDGLTDVIIFSDGNETTGTDSVFAINGVNIHAIMYGAESSEINTGVSSLSAQEFSFIGEDTSVSAEIYYSGITDGETVGVELYEDGKRVGQEIIKSNGIELTGNKITFSYTPETIGNKTLEVKIKSSLPEIENDDNSRVAFIDIISDRNSVLYIDSPGWDYRFLSELLSDTGKIDVNRVLAGPSGTIIGKDTRSAFSSAATLAKNKLIIMGNTASYMSNVELKNLAAYVSSGGSLVLLGGDRSLFAMQGEWSKILGSQSNHTDGDTDGFEVALTQHGKNSKLLKVDDNGDCWNRFQFIQSFHKISPLPGSDVLAVHPWLKCGNAPCPVIYTSNYNRGKLIAFAFQSQWRWRFSESTSECYKKLWNNIIVEMTGTDKKPPVQLFSSKNNMDIGEEITINISLDKDAFKSKNTLKVFLNKENETETLLSEVTVTPDNSDYNIKYAPLDPGVYSLRAEFNDLTSDPEKIYAHISHNEYLQISANQKFAEKVKNNGGEIFKKGNGKQAATYFKEKIEFKMITKPYRPWTRLPFLIVLLLLLTFEWIVRRRGGLT